MHFSKSFVFVGMIVVGVTLLYLSTHKNSVRPAPRHSTHGSKGNLHHRPADLPTSSLSKQHSEGSGPTESIFQNSSTMNSSSAPVRAPASTADGAEIASLESMTATLSTFSRPEVGLSDLTAFLSSTTQKPLVAKQSNPDTGEMSIVRTDNPLLGTRYFHAQYFKDESDQTFLQHMSFEFKPGESAMAEAVAAVRKAFPSLTNPPLVNSPSFVKWALDEKYIVWIKKLEAADLRDNPFNAYTSNDVGTVRVAVEAEIH